MGVPVGSPRLHAAAAACVQPCGRGWATAPWRRCPKPCAVGGLREVLGARIGPVRSREVGVPLGGPSPQHGRLTQELGGGWGMRRGPCRTGWHRDEAECSVAVAGAPRGTRVGRGGHRRAVPGRMGAVHVAWLPSAATATAVLSTLRHRAPRAPTGAAPQGTAGGRPEGRRAGRAARGQGRPPRTGDILKAKRRGQATGEADGASLSPSPPLAATGGAVSTGTQRWRSCEPGHAAPQYRQHRVPRPC